MTTRPDRWRAASTLGGNDGFGEGADPLMSSGTARSVQSIEATRSPRSARGISPRGYSGDMSSSFAPARGAQEIRSFSALVDLRILTADRRDDSVVLYEIHAMAASGARWTVHKRFSDFHAFDAVLSQQILREALKEWRGLPTDRARALLGPQVDPKMDPSELIPSLPSRMQIGRPSDALIDKRRKHLEIYLQGIANNFRALEALEPTSPDARGARRRVLPTACRPQVVQAVLQHLMLFLQQHSLSSIAQGAVAPMSDATDTARGDTSALFAVFQNEIMQPGVPAVIASASARGVGASWSAERPPMRCIHAPGSSYVAMLHLPAVDPNRVLVHPHPTEARAVVVTGSWSVAPLPLELESKLRMLRLLGDSTRGAIVVDTLPVGEFHVNVAVPEEFPLESWFTDYTDGVLSVVWSLFQ